MIVNILLAISLTNNVIDSPKIDDLSIFNQNKTLEVTR